jgi:hypothetical protein
MKEAQMTKNVVSQIQPNADVISAIVGAVLAEEAMQKLFGADALRAQSEGYFAENYRWLQQRDARKATKAQLEKEKAELPNRQAKIVAQMRKNEQIYLEAAMKADVFKGVSRGLLDKARLSLMPQIRTHLAGVPEHAALIKEGLKIVQEMESLGARIASEQEAIQELQACADKAAEEGRKLYAEAVELEREASK